MKFLIGILMIGLAALAFVQADTKEWRETDAAHLNCMHQLSTDTNVNHVYPHIPDRLFDSIFSQHPGFISDGFDFPVGKPNAQDYYKAVEFLQRNHLGEDWNGRGGGNTDLGDPVYSCAKGLVTFAEDVCCGWGKVVRVAHFMPPPAASRYVETVYAHLQNMEVKVGNLIDRGQSVGSIGTANGRYKAHLHLEMRNFVNMALGPGYSADHFGYLSPSDFIRANRPR